VGNSDSKQYDKLDKRMREVETTLSALLATSNQSQENAERALTELKKEVSSVKESCDTLKTERDEARGTIRGIGGVFWVVGCFIGTVSIVLNIYFMLNN